MKYRITSIIVLCSIFSCFSQQTIAFDPAFGSNGKVLLNNQNQEWLSGICVQADGKILLCGSVDSAGKRRILVARFNPNGSPDLTFAQNGLLIDKLQWESSAQDLIVLEDGKILITGGTWASPLSLGSNLFVMKLLPNGAKDLSFGSNGSFIANFSTSNAGGKIKVAPDGNIIIGGGISLYNGNSAFTIFKLSSNGQFDTQFGNGGYTSIPLSFQDHLHDLAIQADGKILFTGGTFSPHHTITMRLNPNGTIDNSFATNGKFIYTFPTNDQGGTNILLTAGNKILVSGYEESNGAGDVFIYRLDSNGAIDSTYGNNGFVDFDSGLSEVPWSMEELPDRSLILSCHHAPGINWGDIELVAFDSLGFLDTTFGNFGTFVYDLDSCNDYVACAALQPDGKLLNAGFSDTSLFVTRLLTSAYTGIKQNKKESIGVKIFPNPAEDMLNIRCETMNDSEGFTLLIVNQLGQIIREEEIVFEKQLATIRIKDLGSGVYFLELKGTIGLAHKRFVVAR